MLDAREQVGVTHDLPTDTTLVSLEPKVSTLFVTDRLLTGTREDGLPEMWE